MRGGTRKVADSKPDVTSPTGDSIPMTFIGMFLIVFSLVEVSFSHIFNKTEPYRMLYT